MRFVFAIVAFVIAAGMIAYGIAQRTVLAPDDRVAAGCTAFDGTAAFTVIDGAVLDANAGPQQGRPRRRGHDLRRLRAHRGCRRRGSADTP